MAKEFTCSLHAVYKKIQGSFTLHPCTHFTVNDELET